MAEASEIFVDKHHVKLVLERMRVLFSGVNGKEFLDEILSKNEPHPIDELKMKQENVEDKVKVETMTVKEMTRTDLKQRSLDISSGPKEKLSVDEQRPSLMQRVETVANVIKLLLKTLERLSDRETERFKVLSRIYLCRRYSHIRWMPLGTADTQDTVFFMIKTFGIKSVEMIKEVFRRMKRTDLVRRLSGCSSGHKQKHSVNEHLPPLIHKVATMRAVTELLLETFNGLGHYGLKDLKWFLQFTFFQRSPPKIPWKRLQAAERADLLVDVMVEMCGQQSVEVIKEVFMDMNRTDLVQMLSETSSRPKGSHWKGAEEPHVAPELQVADPWPKLMQKVETLASVIELLVEKLDLNGGELKDFNGILLRKTSFHRFLSDNLSMLFAGADLQDMVFIIVLTCGEQSVETIKEIFREMEKTDQVQRLTGCSSGLQHKHSAKQHSALIQRVATIAAVKQLLLETLNDLSSKEVKKFKEFLQMIVFQKDLPDHTYVFSHTADRANIVDQMVRIYGRQSVELSREVLVDMNRADLAQRLSKPSSGHKEKHPVCEHQRVLMERKAAIAAVKKILLETLSDLSYWDFEKFKSLLQFTYFQRSLPQIPLSLLNLTDSADLLVDVMLEKQQALEVTVEVFRDMNRSDLVQRLTETSSRLKGPSRSLELEGCGGTVQDCSDWTKLEPEVNSTDADEAPTYSLQSEAGSFECSVSGLRWVCREKVTFKYQFCPPEEPMVRMEHMEYMPAGPLIDVTVIAGRFDEVYLPHWICIEDNPTIIDQFAVLTIDDCGDVVEKASEVTPSHVRLSEPSFSLKMVLVRVGFSVETRCRTLIYKSDIAFLTLHVYLIPSDPGLQQELDKRKLSHGYKIIEKPHPETSLTMNDRFILTADLDTAEIYPERLMLKYEGRDPNFFEVFIDDPDTNFKLELRQEDEDQPIWTCAIRKDEYQSIKVEETVEQSSKPGCSGSKHFVDKHQVQLIEKVTIVGTILDKFLVKRFINQESYNRIRALSTSQEQMRELYSGPLKAGTTCKDIFYKILVKNLPYLIADLERKK